jgi:hypothetical protein
MRESKKRRLEAKRWKVGSSAEFLGLRPEEPAYVDMRLRLASGLKAQRTLRHLTQAGAARAVHSSQSRIAKMEAGDVAVDARSEPPIAFSTRASGLHPVAGSGTRNASTSLRTDRAGSSLSGAM